MSSEKRRSTVRQRSAASLAVPSVGPSTSRTFSDAQSNWRVWSLRCTAWAVATSRIHPDVSPKNRSQASAAAPSSSARYPYVDPPGAEPVSSSTGIAAPVTAPRAAPTRRTRAPRRFHARSDRYHSAVRSASASTRR